MHEKATVCGLVSRANSTRTLVEQGQGRVVSGRQNVNRFDAV